MPGQKKSARRSFESRQNDILQAAISLFAVFGFRGTTTKAIAERAKVNEALIFRHYPNKQALYAAILENIIGQWQQKVGPLENVADKKLEEGLAVIARFMMQKCAKEHEPIRMIHFAALESPKLGNLFFKRKLPLNQILENFFQAKMTSGEVTRKDPKLLTNIFLGMVHNFILVHDVYGAKNFYGPSKTKVMQEMITIFVKGIRQ